MTKAGGRAFAAGLLLGIVAGLWLGVNATSLGPLGDLLDRDQDLSQEAVDVIEDNYYRRVTPEALEGESVRGMVDELRKRFDDRFSHYFDPDELRRFEEATSGRFSGVGLSVRKVKRGLRVTHVFEQAPADKAGIRMGDLIVAVDGESIAGEPAELATAKIKGPPGTQVRLEVRGANGQPRRVEIERAHVDVPAVVGRLRRADGRKVAHVRLAGFNEGAHGELREELERLYRRGAEGLVLDLRGNGGGLLNEAVLTSSIFVEDGVIVTTAGRAQPRQVYRAVGDALDPRPTVVLVDRNTASAAEILAAALDEHGLAELVGTRTFGKGSFQEVIELPNGGALDLTVGEYLTAEGDSLAGKGIAPDVRASDRPGSRDDEALRKGLRALGRKLAGQG